MEPFLGQIMMVGFDFAPRGWALCNGQLLSIAQNTALFSLLGTTYGGDGRTTFALPDLRGRCAVGMGQGPGLTLRNQGEMAGSENTTLTVANIPAHTHPAQVSNIQVQMMASNEAGTEETPGNNNATTLAASTNQGRGVDIYNSSTPNVALNTGNSPASGSVTVGMTGGNIPVNNMQPFLGVNYIIALQGIFPSRQ
ncbi:phage tail protein [Algoriphagus aestuariicola]|jgi:microcystin-dependent protein|uniref:Phage tail protein n=1 Tax=Algoriphagus aestuariicola TaxID=1852016 RepID=A0ABS3BW64_9BACT|nr:tail fiber protein [Algoriphagus aestuariicola]MBN7803545.1 phage tail protein [Algoriphagus aestuariicola]